MYNTDEVSFDQLLDVFWERHDPTQLNRQGNDVGTQYRWVGVGDDVVAQCRCMLCCAVQCCAVLEDDVGTVQWMWGGCGAGRGREEDERDPWGGSRGRFCCPTML